MSKYIIDIPKTVGMLEAVGSVHYTYFDGIQVQTIVLKGDEIEELTADYINKHFGDLQDTAYQRGFEEGKAVSNKGCAGCKYAEMGSDTTICAQCCNAYHNQWTANQTDDEIKVGDEVKPFYTDITGVVTLIYLDTIYVLWRDGSSTSTLKMKEVVKTGRHFDIASILKEMQS